MKQSLIAGVLMAMCLPVFAQNAPTLAPTDGQSALPQNISQKIQELSLSPEVVSLYVKPLNAQTPLISHHADTPRTPASTQKLITTFVALDTLGANHRWYTHVYKTGVVAGGVLYGNLIIKGEGDPSLTHERLKAMLAYLPKKGIRHIKGDIVIDNRAFLGVAGDVNAFDGQGYRAYNAQPNAFLVNYGTLEIDLLPSGQLHKTGETDRFGKPITVFVPSDDKAVALQVLPPISDFTVPTTLTASAGECNSEPNFRITPTALNIQGTAKASCGRVSYWLTYANGDEFAVRAVKGLWQKLDPTFMGQVRLAHGADKAVGLPVLSYPSRSLSEQIYDINQYSNNVMTEQVALSLPLSAGETVSTYAKAFDFINKWWQQHLNSPAPVMSKASGLCRDCAISVRAMGEMLEKAHQHPEFEVFKRSLPIAGQTGTMTRLAYRDKTHPAIGRAFIKTGTLDNVTSMAGYALDSQDNWYVVVGTINTPNAGNGAVLILDEMLRSVAIR